MTADPEHAHPTHIITNPQRHLPVHTKHPGIQGQEVQTGYN